MLEKLYLGLALLFFILAFAIKNVRTYLKEKKPIKGKSVKLTVSIAISTLIYVLILLRLTFLQPHWILEVDLSQYSIIRIIGNVLVLIGFVAGIFALISMKNSWRVGIKYDQKTNLVTSGIYRMSRNPYFFSYDILILGFILHFPSLVLFLLYLILVFVFHYMILEEEKYLESLHGGEYLKYKKRVGRYVILK